MSKKIIQKYETKHTINLYKIQKEVEKILQLPENEIIDLAKKLTKGQVLTSKALQNKLDIVQKKMDIALRQTMTKYGKASSKLSDDKIKELLYDAFKKPAADIIIAKEFAEGSEVATNIFTKRAGKGFKLSERVWKLAKQKRIELDNAVRAAISQGASAQDLSKEITKYLREPDKVFKRVRDSEGNLVDSKARKAYKPGKGIYKSAEANARRLAATETNIAYRTADHERWKEMDMVKGVRVDLSNRHPVYDICDNLKGEYPKGFKFTGWHPQCLCHATPILISEKELSKYEDFILGITDKAPTTNNISAAPKGLKKWVSDNEERVKKWKSKPYWMLDNKQYLK